MFRGKYSAADEAQKLIDKAFYWTITSSWHPLINMRSRLSLSLCVRASHMQSRPRIYRNFRLCYETFSRFSLAPGSGPFRIEFRELKKNIKRMFHGWHIENKKDRITVSPVHWLLVHVTGVVIVRRIYFYASALFYRIPVPTLSDYSRSVERVNRQDDTHPREREKNKNKT
jgi:hypothetical protein